MNLNSVLLIGYLLLGIFNISSIRERVVIKQENKELLTNDNSVFVLKDTINLYGDTVLLGKNSQLKFRGGCLKNGTIIGDNNRITGLKKVVFSDIHFKGSFVVKKVSYKNFGYYRSYISEYNTEKVGEDTYLIAAMFDLALSGKSPCTLEMEPNRTYRVWKEPIFDNQGKRLRSCICDYTDISDKIIEGNNATILDLRTNHEEMNFALSIFLSITSSKNLTIQDLNYRSENNDWGEDLYRNNDSTTAGLFTTWQLGIGYFGQTFIHLYKDCYNIKIQSKIYGARYGVISGDYSRPHLTGENGLVNSELKSAAERCGYPITIHLGSNNTIDVSSDKQHRTCWLAGLSNSKINIVTRNEYVANRDCILSPARYALTPGKYKYRGSDNLSINIKVLPADDRDSQLDKGPFEITMFTAYEREPVTMSNIDVSIEVDDESMPRTIMWNDSGMGLEDVFKNIHISSSLKKGIISSNRTIYNYIFFDDISRHINVDFNVKGIDYLFAQNNGNETINVIQSDIPELVITGKVTIEDCHNVNRIQFKAHEGYDNAENHLKIRRCSSPKGDIPFYYITKDLYLDTDNSDIKVFYQDKSCKIINVKNDDKNNLRVY